MKDYFEIAVVIVLGVLFALGAAVAYGFMIICAVILYLAAAAISTAKWWFPPLILVVALRVLGVI